MIDKRDYIKFKDLDKVALIEFIIEYDVYCASVNDIRTEDEDWGIQPLSASEYFDYIHGED